MYKINDHIYDCFIINNINTLTLNNIYDYIKNHYNKYINIKDVKKNIDKLIKNGYFILQNNKYILTEKGNSAVNNHKKFNIEHINIIINFFKRKRNNKIKKNYTLKEIRNEQPKLRRYLQKNRENICIICKNQFPIDILETAHLKPREILKDNELNDIKNICEFMCPNCHKLYDRGYISVYNGLLKISIDLDKYDLGYKENSIIDNYNLYNKKYFHYHYNLIFRNNLNYKNT